MDTKAWGAKSWFPWVWGSSVHWFSVHGDFGNAATEWGLHEWRHMKLIQLAQRAMIQTNQLFAIIFLRFHCTRRSWGTRHCHFQWCGSLSKWSLQHCGVTDTRPMMTPDRWWHQTDDEGPRGGLGSEQECVAGWFWGTSWLVMHIHTVRAGYEGIWWKSKHALCAESHRGNPQCWRDKLCNSVQNLLLF